MSVQWILVSRLIGVVARHLQAYRDTAAADAALLAKNLRRRLLASLVAMASATLCVSLGVAWIFGIVWNTPWRNPVLATMLGILALCAVIGAALASRSRKSTKRSFAGLRRELSLDQSLLDGLCARDRLQESRGEMQNLFNQATAPDTGRGFPRSKVMRLLLGLKGLGGLLNNLR